MKWQVIKWCVRVCTASHRVLIEWEKVRFMFLQLQVQEVDALWLSPQHRPVHCLPQLLQRPPQTGTWVGKWLFNGIVSTHMHRTDSPTPIVLVYYNHTWHWVVSLDLCILCISYMTHDWSAESCTHTWTQIWQKSNSILQLKYMFLKWKWIIVHAINSISNIWCKWQDVRLWLLHYVDIVNL